MSANPNALLPRVRRWADRSRLAAAPDAELIRRFAAARDEAAFAALVDRHGPMVLGTARRVVGDHHTAEDVFQATFLALARQADRLRHPDALPAWLHRTARHFGLKAVRGRSRRRGAEARYARPTSNTDDLSVRELLAILDEELARLPETFRLPLLMCCLEGRSQEEAAGLLGWTPGSVKGRLERGRQRLKDRLARRGLTFTVGAGVPLLLVPRLTLAAPLREATVRAALGGTVQPTVAALVSAGALPRISRALVVVATALLAGGLAFAPVPKTEPPPAAPPDAADRPAGQLPAGAVARFGWSPRRIGNSAFALTPDGKTIVAVSPEGIVRRFDAATGRLLAQRQLTDRTRLSPFGQDRVKLSADGRVAAFYENAGDRHRLSVWDVDAGKVLFREIPGQGPGLVDFGLSGNGKWVTFSEALGRQIRFRAVELATGKATELGEPDVNYLEQKFSADGRRLVVEEHSAIASRGAFLSCYDVPAGKRLWRLPHRGNQFAVSPDGRTVVSADSNGTFRVVETNPDTGAPAERFQDCPFAEVYGRTLFAPDNRTLVMSRFQEVVLWDVRTGREIRRLAKPADRGHGYGPELGGMSPDGRTLLSNFDMLQRWDLTTGKPLFDAAPDDGFGGPVMRLAFTPDGKEVFASAWNRSAARWDVATGRRSALSYQRLGYQLVTTPAGLWAVASNGRYAWVFDPITGREIQTVQWADSQEFGADGLRAFTLATDGRTLLVAHADDSRPNRRLFVSVFDIQTERRLARFTVPVTPYFAASTVSIPGSFFSPCGRWAVFTGKVFHTGSGTELFTPAGAASERLESTQDWTTKGSVWFPPDGRLLAGRLERSDTLAVWELASGRILARFPQSAQVAQVAFAPDGRTVALVDGWGIRLRDLLTGRPLADYPAPDITCDYPDRSCPTQTAAFAPDGRTLATGHRDGTIVLWTVPRPPAHAPADDWADLGSEDPTRARAAVDRLSRNPAAAVDLLKVKFAPPRAAAAPHAVQRLPLSGETLRGVRAIEVLERVGTPAARELLTRWANQGQDVRLAAEARTVLARINPSAKRPSE